MTEILTESFCERCGTRYTFESAQQRARPLGRLGTLGRGLKNFVVMDDASFDEAMAVARSEDESKATNAQLEAFHRTFNFCLTCRQYTCAECWNAVEGRCLTCAPMPVEEVLEAPAAFSAAAVALLAPAPLAAPRPELGRESRPAIEVEPGSPRELPDAEPAEPAGEVDVSGGEAPPADASEVIADEAEATGQEAIEPIAEPVPERVPEPAATVAVAVAVDGEPAADTSLELEPEPVPAFEPAAESRPEAEPIAELEPVAELAAEAEVEPEPAGEVDLEPRPVADLEPELERVADLEPEPEPERRSTSSAPPPEPVPGASAPAPSPFPGFQPGRSLDDEIAAYELRIAALASPLVRPEPTIQPAAFVRREPPPAVLPAATGPGLAAAPVEAEGPTARPAGALTPGTCRSCGLSISASARFCRRCGSRQDN